MAVHSNGTLSKNLKAVYSLIYSFKREVAMFPLLVASLADRPRRERRGRQGTEVDLVITRRELEREVGRILVRRRRVESSKRHFVFNTHCFCWSYCSSDFMTSFWRGFDRVSCYILFWVGRADMCCCRNFFLSPPKSVERWAAEKEKRKEMNFFERNPGNLNGVGCIKNSHKKEVE